MPSSPRWEVKGQIMPAQHSAHLCRDHGCGGAVIKETYPLTWPSARDAYVLFPS